MPSFRVQSRYIFLTWSDLPEFNIHDLEVHCLETLSAEKYICCKETHQDGRPHAHAFIDFGRKIDKRIQAHWDFFEQHPNIKSKPSKRARLAAIAYCKKDGNFVTNYDDEESDEEDTTRPDLNERARESPSFAEFLQWGFTNDVPYGYIAAAWSAAKQSSETIIGDDIVDGEILSPELLLLRFDPTERRALCIQGPTGCGKTVWARKNAPRPSLFCRHIDDLKNFRAGFHVSIIFDDMSFCGDVNGKGAWPRTSQIHLVDFDCGSSIHCRYSTAFIPKNVFRLFTCNEYPFSDDPAIQRRINHIYV